MRGPHLLLLLLCALAGTGAAAAAPLAPGVEWQPGSFAPGRQPDGNSVLFVGPDALVLVDSGRHIEHTQALLDRAAALGRPIGAVVNTHWHLDHLGGNALLRAQRPGLQVWASAAVDAALHGWLADSRARMQAALAGGGVDAATEAMMRIDLALIDAAPRLRPDHVIDGAATLHTAGRPLQLGLARQAVTAADVWVFDPASGVLAVGDLVTLPAPLFDTACPPGWQAALARLERLPFRTLVPGHGAPMDRAAFGRWRAAFDGLLACAAGTEPDAACSAGWATALGPLLPAADRTRADALLGHYLGQHLRAEAPQRDRYCRP